jgi:hypothetical protein
MLSSEPASEGVDACGREIQIESFSFLVESESAYHLDTIAYRIVRKLLLRAAILGYADFYGLVDSGLGRE